MPTLSTRHYTRTRRSRTVNASSKYCGSIMHKKDGLRTQCHNASQYSFIDGYCFAQSILRATATRSGLLERMTHAIVNNEGKACLNRVRVFYQLAADVFGFHKRFNQGSREIRKYEPDLYVRKLQMGLPKK